MNKRRIIVLLVLVSMILGGMIVFAGILLISSPEYYKGFDWKTGEKKLECRLGKKYNWYDAGEYKEYISERYYPKCYKNTWARDGFYIDKKTGTLSSSYVRYVTNNCDEMMHVYESQKREFEKKMGTGIEYESFDFVYTEWRGRFSIIKVIRNDYAYNDSNTSVQIIYQDKNRLLEPYFTDAHVTESVFRTMIERFYCISVPDVDFDTLDTSKEYDFSYYKLSPTDETKKVVALMNKVLFTGDENLTYKAKKIAKAKGITEEHPLTLDWIMVHPMKTVKILRELTRDEDFLKNKSAVDKAYEQLTDEEKSNF